MRRKCTFEGCDHREFSAGLCHGHYAQKRRGKPLTKLRELGRDLIPVTIRLSHDTWEKIVELSENGNARVTARRILEAATGTSK